MTDHVADARRRELVCRHVAAATGVLKDSHFWRFCHEPAKGLIQSILENVRFRRFDDADRQIFVDALPTIASALSRRGAPVGTNIGGITSNMLGRRVLEIIHILMLAEEVTLRYPWSEWDEKTEEILNSVGEAFGYLENALLRRAGQDGRPAKRPEKTIHEKYLEALVSS